jgi:hypothetical protein
MAPLLTVNVLPAKVGQTVFDEELVVCIHPAGKLTVSLEIKETVWSVGKDSLISFHKLNGFVGEVPDVIHAGLATAVEVLASELGDTDGFAESGPLLDPGLEVFDLEIVPVDEHLINVTVIAAVTDKLLHPNQAVGVTGGGRASEGVTIVGARPEVLVPSIDSVFNTEVGLLGFVDLIETKGVGSITGLGKPEEFVNLVLGGTPEHDADGNASVLERRRDLRVPKVEHPDALGIGEERDPLVIPHTPSNSELSGTGRSGSRGLGFNILGRLGGRRGRVALGRVVLAGNAGWFGSGAGGPGLAPLGTTLLPGDVVMVRKLPSQVVRPYRDRKGLGWSERAEKNSERG